MIEVNGGNDSVFVAANVKHIVTINFICGIKHGLDFREVHERTGSFRYELDLDLLAKRSSICHASTFFTAAAVLVSKLPSSLRKPSKLVPIGIFCFPKKIDPPFGQAQIAFWRGLRHFGLEPYVVTERLPTEPQEKPKPADLAAQVPKGQKANCSTSRPSAAASLASVALRGRLTASICAYAAWDTPIRAATSA